MDTFNVGDVILDKYEVTAILGKGGMGIVLAARHRELHELRALKFLLPAFRDRPDLCARFAREARTGTRIKDQHVAQVHDVGTFDGMPFMVMEHLTGQPLSAIIRERGPLPIAESADLLLQACQAINVAHALGIIHRDLKPENIFVTSALDGTPCVKVLDFGISKTSAKDDGAETTTTDVFGSPRYMSPEQLGSARNVDTRTDVWSLGVVLYEMLAGTSPFVGETLAMTCTAIISGRYAKLAELRPDVPPALEQMLSETLVPDRDARLPTVEAFAAGLASFATEAGRASYAHIQRLAARGATSARSAVSLPDAESLSSPVGDGASTRTSTPTTTGPPSQAASVPAPRRTRRTATLGIGAAASAAVLAVVLPRAWHALRTSSQSSPTDDAGVVECASGATAACEAACTGGKPGACEALAKALAKGVGAPQDVPRAKTLYTTACDGGSLAACNSLGSLYARGEGADHDDTKALPLYKQACDKGYAPACVNLGMAHFEGSGVPKNESLGASFFLRGCDAGVLAGCVGVSIAYAEGRGVPKDAQQANAYADRACKGGLLAGCVRLGMAKVTGDGVAKDVKGGLAQLEDVCTRGEPAGCESLARIYTNGLGTDVPADPLRVREYRKKACDLGSKRSCAADKLLAQIDNGGATTAEVNALYQKQCDMGTATACGLLGENLLRGAGLGVDREKGKALLGTACKGGFERACKDLAEAKNQ